MQKRDPIYRLGQAAWVVGTLGLAALAFVYAGLPAAGFVDELIFGPKPRDHGFLLTVAWLFIVPNIAVAPIVVVSWLSKKAFGIGNEEEGSE